MGDLCRRASNNIQRYGVRGFVKSVGDVAIRNLIPADKIVQIGKNTIDGIVYRSDLSTHDDMNGIFYFSERDEISIQKPITIQSAPKLFIDYYGTYEIPQPFVCDLSDITLVGSKAVGIDSDNQIILETMMSRRDLVDKYFRMKPTDIYYYMKQPKYSEENQYESPIACLVEYYGGFHHWMYNSLPRLQGIKEFEKRTGKDCKILVPQNPPTYMRESLELFGYGSEDLIEWNQYIRQPKSLIIPTIRRIENTNASSSDISRKIPSPSAAQWLRETAIANIEEDLDDYPSNIIISRADVPTRRIINKDELYPHLRVKGFTPFKLANLSFREQVAVFASAENIISPHGAGLSNLYFAENANVIEILGTNVKKPTYYFLSEVLDHNYGAVIGHQNPDGNHNSDILVELDHIDQMINKIGI